MKELHCLAPRLLAAGERTVWVTNDTAQTRSLLQGEDVLWVPYLGSRNLPGTARAAAKAVGVLARLRPAITVSTGSGIALAYLPAARALGAACHYIESATRVSGPSATGVALARVPGIRCYTQHSIWSGGRWGVGGSVMDGFTSVRTLQHRPIRRVVVTLGTWRQPFRRLVDRVQAVLPEVAAPDVQVLWQTGHTPVPDVPSARPFVPAHELVAAVRRADLVITHAGMGATLDALQAGRCPVVVPRTARAGEQVDDHQVELARTLVGIGLAVVADADDLSAADLRAAAHRSTRFTPAGQFVLC